MRIGIILLCIVYIKIKVSHGMFHWLTDTIVPINGI